MSRSGAVGVCTRFRAVIQVCEGGGGPTSPPLTTGRGMSGRANASPAATKTTDGMSAKRLAL